MNEINYSVIIPHKNIPDLLYRCLNSIPRRDDIQIIVVDDNSDSEKVDFEHFPGVGEKCVEVYFTKEGKGAGYARNVGLKHAKGKWLLFADADDFYVPNVFEVIDKFSNSDNDVVYFKLLDKNSLNIIPRTLQQTIDIKRANAFNSILCSSEINIKINHIVPYGKMIRGSIVQKNCLLFDEILCSNDVMFFVKLAFCVHKIAISKDCMYCVSKPLGHNLTAKKDYISGKVRLQVLLNRNQYLQQKGLDDMLISPLVQIWKFRHLGVVKSLSYCLIVIRSSTPLLTGWKKFLKNPQTYLKLLFH